MQNLTKLLLVLSLSLAPLFGQTETASTDPCQQAAIDAGNDINKTMWFGAGCLLGVLGWGASYVIKPEPPATRLVGKDDMYVAKYTDCYREEAKKIQNKSALKGCLTYAGTYLVLNLMLLSSM